MTYVSRHKKEDVAVKKAQTKANQTKNTHYVTADEKYFYVVVEYVEGAQAFEYQKNYCPYTGAEIGRRSKSYYHAGALMDEAYQLQRDCSGLYNAVGRFLTDATGTPDEQVAKARQFMEEYKSKSRQKKEAEWKREKNLKERREKERAARKARNHMLREHGYKWSKWEPVDEEDEDFFGPTEWQLHHVDKDGKMRRVSEEQALDEIERGIDVVHAELVETARQKGRYVASYQVFSFPELDDAIAAHYAEEDALLKAKGQQIRAARAQIQDTMTGVEKFDSEGFEVSLRIDDFKIERGRINDVECAVISFKLFDEYRYGYYSLNPDAAGLTALPEVELTGLAATFAKMV